LWLSVEKQWGCQVAFMGSSCRSSNLEHRAEGKRRQVPFSFGKKRVVLTGRELHLGAGVGPGCLPTSKVAQTSRLAAFRSTEDMMVVNSRIDDVPG
jgi:hypothetical protein